MVCNSDSYYWNFKNFKAIYVFVRVSMFSWCWLQFIRYWFLLTLIYGCGNISPDLGDFSVFTHDVRWPCHKFKVYDAMIMILFRWFLSLDLVYESQWKAVQSWSGPVFSKDDDACWLIQMIWCLKSLVILMPKWDEACTRSFIWYNSPSWHFMSSILDSPLPKSSRSYRYKMRTISVFYLCCWCSTYTPASECVIWNLISVWSYLQRSYSILGLLASVCRVNAQVCLLSPLLPSLLFFPFRFHPLALCVGLMSIASISQSRSAACYIDLYLTTSENISRLISICIQFSL